MIKSIFTIAIISSMIITSCKSVSNDTKNDKDQKNTTVTNKTTNDVPYVDAQRYFVKNNFVESKLKSPKITTQKEFEEIFGMATVMGADGKPTAIDFSKQYVITVIGKETDKVTTMNVLSLNQKDNNIVLSYEIKEGVKGSFTMQPFILIIVDNKYQGEIIIEKK